MRLLRPPEKRVSDAASQHVAAVIIFGLNQRIAELPPGRRAEAEELEDEIARRTAERLRLSDDNWENESQMLKLGARMVDIIGGGGGGAGGVGVECEEARMDG